MPQTTSTLSNSLRTQYIEEYQRAAKAERVYDQVAYPISRSQDILQRGNTVQVPFIAEMDIGTTAISQVYDLTPQTLRDAVVTVVPTSRAEAIQDSELLLLQHYTDYAASRYRIVGKNMMLSVDLLAMEAGLKGSLVIRPAARASLDAGTSSHRLADSEMSKVSTTLQALRCPRMVTNVGAQWVAIMPPEAYYDMRTGGNVVEVAKYQKANIILNEELGMYGHFRIVVTPWAKVFGAAGADNGSATVATTLSSAATGLSTTIVVASATGITTGRLLTIGTEESSSTYYPMNERVRAISASGTTITIVGEGPNGGLRFDHASGAGVRNADSVYPVLYGGPMSLAKVYATEVGEFGEVVGPLRQGLVEQWVSLGWKWYGQYGRISESWLARGEYSSSMDA